VAVERLPLFPIPRVLLPGTCASLPWEGLQAQPGEEIVAVLRADAHLPVEPRVGTRSVVEMVRPLGRWVSLVRVRGHGLVRLLGRDRKGDREQARVTEIPEPGTGFAARLDEAERALHRYLALSAEAGEPVGTLPRLSRDPVMASHEVASYLRVSWPEVQEILEAGSAADRLCRERAALDREAELLRRLLGREGA
jgi:hypothetical protein